MAPKNKSVNSGERLRVVRHIAKTNGYGCEVAAERPQDRLHSRNPVDKVVKSKVYSRLRKHDPGRWKTRRHCSVDTGHFAR